MQIDSAAAAAVRVETMLSSNVVYSLSLSSSSSSSLAASSRRWAVAVAAWWPRFPGCSSRAVRSNYHSTDIVRRCAENYTRTEPHRISCSTSTNARPLARTATWTEQRRERPSLRHLYCLKTLVNFYRQKTARIKMTCSYFFPFTRVCIFVVSISYIQLFSYTAARVIIKSRIL